MDIFSLLSTVIDLIDWVEKRIKRPSPIQILNHRKRIKRKIENNLEPQNEYGNHGEAIIRNLKKIDSYPDLDKRSNGISPWFKVEIKGLYHRGLEVFISMPLRVVFDKKSEQWKSTKNKNGRIAYPVGRISFDNIIKIDWKGDEHYPCPHIYCNYKGKKGEPYELILFYEHKKVDNQNYFLELTNPPKGSKAR